MSSLRIILDWGFWGIAAIYCLSCFVSRPQSRGDRSLKLSMGIALAFALALTAVLPVYKSIALVAIPIAYIWPMVYLMFKVKRAGLNMGELMKESNGSGIPLGELIESKTTNLKLPPSR